MKIGTAYVFFCMLLAAHGAFASETVTAAGLAGDGHVRLTVANAKPGLSYAVSGVSNLREPFAPPTEGWQRYAGESEGSMTVSAEAKGPAAFFKVYAANR